MFVRAVVAFLMSFCLQQNEEPAPEAQRMHRLFEKQNRFPYRHKPNEIAPMKRI